MENWGCIFLDEGTTNPNSKKAGAGGGGGRSSAKSSDAPSAGVLSLVQLIMHEVAHLWLGNLVTLPFWVKEGLAQYFEEIMAAEALQTAAPSSSSNASKKPVSSTPTPTAAAAATRPVAAGVAGPGSSATALSEEKKSNSGSDASASVTSLGQGFSKLFNGMTYSAALRWVRDQAGRMGPDAFREAMRGLVQNNALGVVDEKTFLEYVGVESASI